MANKFKICMFNWYQSRLCVFFSFIITRLINFKDINMKFIVMSKQVFFAFFTICMSKQAFVKRPHNERLIRIEGNLFHK